MLQPVFGDKDAARAPFRPARSDKLKYNSGSSARNGAGARAHGQDKHGVEINHQIQKRAHTLSSSRARNSVGGRPTVTQCWRQAHSDNECMVQDGSAASAASTPYAARSECRACSSHSPPFSVSILYFTAHG